MSRLRKKDPRAVDPPEKTADTDAVVVPMPTAAKAPSLELIVRVRADEPGAFDELQRQQKGLLVKLTTKILNSKWKDGSTREDSEQVALLALLKAARTWDVTKGSWAKYTSGVICNELRWDLWVEPQEVSVSWSLGDRPLADQKPDDGRNGTVRFGGPTPLFRNVWNVSVDAFWYLLVVGPDGVIVYNVGDCPSPNVLTRMPDGAIRCTCSEGRRRIRPCVHSRAGGSFLAEEFDSEGDDADAD